MKENIKTKNINYVIGLGRSGFWAAKYLNSIKKKVIVIESEINKEIYNYKNELESIGVKVELDQSFEFEFFTKNINEIEYVIISPGISLEHKTIIKLKEKGVKIIGEVNIGWNNLKKVKWVGITGTNGKTTVTHLLSHILCSNNLKAPAAGNIGTPICKYAYDQNDNLKIDWIIAELSSYQIEIAKRIEPQIGIWTTFTPDHLERHKTIQNYFNIKNKLLKQSNYRIYNYDDKILRESSNVLSKGIWITSNVSDDINQKCDYWIDKEGFVIERGIKLFDLGIFNLTGKHNIQNLLMATAAARKIGLSSLQISESLKSYKQLPHRLETIFKNNNIEIINDSKATNFDSTIASLNSISNSSVLISGGRIKTGNYKLWVDTVIRKTDAIFLYGESCELIKNYLLEGGYRKKIIISNSLKDVVSKVIEYTNKEKKKIILFSPSCSSFDQFKDYEERGNIFKYLISKSNLS
tara:strand:+ start:11195 stop:12592 length:1398 start_codon:yes stop_codon:yes gene_type:complete